MKGYKVKVTSTSSFEGVKIEEYLEPITSHVVVGMNAFKDFISGFTDYFGGNSRSYQNTLSSMNAEVVDDLRKKASLLGANCILGLKLDNDEISAQGKSMMMVTAVGTAAIAEFKSKSMVAPKEKRANTLYKEDFVILNTKRKYLEDIKNNKLRIDDSFWEFVKNNNFTEVSSLIIDRYVNFVNSCVDYQKDSLNKFRVNVYEYLLSIDDHTSTLVLYDKLKEDLSIKGRIGIETLIVDAGLIDYSKILDLLENSSFSIQRSGLNLTSYPRSAFEKDDMLLIENIIDKLSGKFTKRGEETSVKKMLSSKDKKVWNCECGRVNDMDVVYCEKCNNDIYGFGVNDINVDKATEILSTTLLVLKGVMV